jgi:hypothetical protein
MRPVIPAPLSRPDLAAAPAHLIARDYPETLAIFRRFGVDLMHRGGGPVMGVVEGDTGELLYALAEALDWRRGAGGAGFVE